LFEELRREYEFGVGSIAGVARKFGVHRRLVREALGQAVPQQRPAKARARPKTGPLAAFIDGILEADRRAPRKQRHTAHRIWVRIGKERPDLALAESTVRQYVRERKLMLGLRTSPEVYVPQQYAWGQEAQVDWYEAAADLDDERQTVQVFALRSMASGAAFHRAYPRATQQAFLEAHELAFEQLGGVFRRLRYDNLGAAVKKILRGSRREETASKEKVGSSAAIIWCRCRRSATWTSSTRCSWLAATRIWRARWRVGSRRSVKRWPSNASTCCHCPATGSI
jgi:transposase